MVTLRLEDGRLRVEVKDDSAVVPSRKRYGPEAGTGRGLLLVESLTAAWGCDTAPDGKSVWFELHSANGEQPSDADFGLNAADLADLAELGPLPSRADRRSRGGGHPRGQPVDRHHRLRNARIGGAHRR